MKKTLQLTCLLLYASSHAFATVKSDHPKLLTPLMNIPGFSAADQVKGTVRDATGTTLPGVSVQVKGTKLVTQTNASGQYGIAAKAGDILVFSYIGYDKQEITVGSQTTVDVVLKSNTQELNTVVVTALGIKRTSRSTTYSTQQVDGDELTRAKDANLVNSLNGKVAGLTISRSSSGVGGSAKVILRGSKSASGSNQALYVIDGVPMNNSISSQAVSSTGNGASTQPNSAYGGSTSYDGGDPISNLNPEDIASISVLKGGSAAALYGSQAANGVIIVTTKSGEAGKAKVNFTSGFSIDQAATKPEFQNKYGQTSGNSSQSWGPAITNGQDNLKSYFRTGQNYTNSISLSAGSEKLQTYFSYANTTSSGIQPGNELSRHNVNLKETGSFFNDKLTISGNVNYIRQKINNSPLIGLYFNPLTGLYLFPRGLDIKPYKTGFEQLDPTRNLNTQNWPFLSEDIQQNPWWINNRNQNELNRDRLMLNVSAKYKVNPWLDIQARGSMDTYTDTYDQKNYAGTSITLTDKNGSYVYSNNNSRQQYADVIANFNVPLEHFKITGTVGTSIQDFYDNGVTFNSGKDGLNIPNKFVIQNFKALNPLNSGNTYNHKQIRSVFASASVAFDNWINLDATIRTDWSSALAFTTGNPFSYPSVGINFIINEKLNLPQWVSFAKVRGSYAQVGNDVPNYVTNILNSFGAGGGISTPIRSSFVDLKPERTNSLEFGTEWRFFSNRLNFDFTFYKTNTKNQFFTADASQASLFNQYYFNAGNVQNKGIEVVLGYDILNGDGLKWKTTVNYSMNRNKILALSPEINEFTLSGASGANYVSKFKVGGSFGDIYGTSLKRDDQGRVLIIDGKPTAADGGNNTFLGNANPRWQLGWGNTFNYKNFSLTFLLDGKFGGKVMSITESMLEQYGVAKVTGDARDQGGVSVNGVDQAGNPVSKVDAQKWYSVVGGREGISSEHMYSATVVRMRELSFGYNIPMKPGFIKNLKLSVTGRNLFYLYKKAPFDPELSMSTANGLSGVDIFMPPALRNYGFSLNANF
ncbi:TonB-linked SusC/RagA family outer membrane protein [Pedobacter cryoconitis]|uniref:TonB-linked SusC/RagA family outer membrane protein n=1 Tax=Pedobacter cryoconitis TaxID=188932 RepID=A0A7W9DYG1_9SPHI|nr:SusC/RagA family TonB-linked outer membrane protein [Pedobacter cryoconitis]MBB5635886.1 TonB-linked SusC/RagA family outer membrane protein [Pedobacter cryoconitis]